MWPCPSWGPSWSGSSPLIGCLVGVTTQGNFPGAHPTKSSCLCGQPSTPSWGEHLFLMPRAWYPLGWEQAPIPELLHTDLQRNGTPACLLCGSLYTSLGFQPVLSKSPQPHPPHHAQLLPPSPPSHQMMPTHTVISAHRGSLFVTRSPKDRGLPPFSMDHSPCELSCHHLFTAMPPTWCGRTSEGAFGGPWPCLLASMLCSSPSAGSP